MMSNLVVFGTMPIIPKAARRSRQYVNGGGYPSATNRVQEFLASLIPNQDFRSGVLQAHMYPISLSREDNGAELDPTFARIGTFCLKVDDLVAATLTMQDAEVLKLTLSENGLSFMSVYRNISQSFMNDVLGTEAQNALEESEALGSLTYHANASDEAQVTPVVHNVSNADQYSTSAHIAQSKCCGQYGYK